MPTEDWNTRYNQTRSQLFNALMNRTTLLRRLDSLIRPVLSPSQSTSTVIEFDCTGAQELLDLVQATTAQISNLMQKVNEYGKQIGAPAMHWEHAPSSYIL
jgi:Zn-dependent oligopeptidase